MTLKKRNITQEKIFQAAILVIETEGLENLSFPLIAQKLEIKTPSMYNHFKNKQDLKGALSLYLYDHLNTIMQKKLVGISGEEAITIFTMTIFDFAFTYPNTYPLLQEVTEVTKERNSMALYSNTLRSLLKDFASSDEDLLFKHRAVRSMLHGYISLKLKGFFKRGESDNPYTDFERFNTQMIHLILN
ncbi:TetR/AcrR family transcriptional regulator [Listeria fleischmannii]|uniref:TetR/AcrR family transcriptional regulator n=1 Tax=Listeria fleischmannii TaxID=1069827 RepID=UPI001CB767F8|nr:TetR/AcrR family transcriptional regulator [Listeria fleischmannii]